MSIKSKERIENLKKKIFFNPLIRSLYLSCLKFYFSAIVSFKGDVSITAIIIVATITLVSLILAGILYKNEKHLDEETCISKFGAAYDGKTLTLGRRKFIWVEPLWFFGRRIVFAIATVFLLDNPPLQMMIHQGLTIATIIHMSYDNLMFASRIRMVLEIGNEVLLLFTSIVMQESMRVEYSEDTRSNLNITTILAIIILVVFNVIIISYQLVEGCCEKCHKKKLEKLRKENTALYLIRRKKILEQQKVIEKEAKQEIKARAALKLKK